MMMMCVCVCLMSPPHLSDFPDATTARAALYMSSRWNGVSQARVDPLSSIVCHSSWRRDKTLTVPAARRGSGTRCLSELSAAAHQTIWWSREPVAAGPPQSGTSLFSNGEGEEDELVMMMMMIGVRPGTPDIVISDVHQLTNSLPLRHKIYFFWSTL